MHLEIFQKQLEKEVGKKLKLRINENKATMMSVKWEEECTHISLHKFFLRAPKKVLNGLVTYILQQGREMSLDVKLFIDRNVRKLDYSNRIDVSKLDTKGKTYDLDKMLHDLNKKYFDGKLDLRITWFGHGQRRNKTRVTFGLYDYPLKLIKINRMLDSAQFPEYLVSFVIYHEMLHCVCPPYVDQNGRNHIHSKQFKRLEAQFEKYELAEKWIEKNIDNFFAKLD